MPANVEIKARVRDWESTWTRASALAEGPARVLHQRDTFFPAANGRLKLRKLDERVGELIAYVRPDTSGPKASRYTLAPTSDPDAMEAALAGALGVRGRVVKTRYLFMAGRTRIHLDRVEGLGDFLELEAVLRPGEDPAIGEAEARDLMARLGVTGADLVQGAYMDLIEVGA